MTNGIVLFLRRKNKTIRTKNWEEKRRLKYQIIDILKISKNKKRRQIYALIDFDKRGISIS